MLVFSLFSFQVTMFLRKIGAFDILESENRKPLLYPVRRSRLRLIRIMPMIRSYKKSKFTYKKITPWMWSKSRLWSKNKKKVKIKLRRDHWDVITPTRLMYTRKQVSNYFYSSFKYVFWFLKNLWILYLVLNKFFLNFWFMIFFSFCIWSYYYIDYVNIRCYYLI